MMIIHVLNESYGSAFDDNDNQSHGQVFILSFKIKELEVCKKKKINK